MLPVVFLACCFSLFLMIPIVLFLGTYIFRLSCHLCGLPKPGMLSSAGKMFLSGIVVALALALVNLLVILLCEATGVPRWEGEFVTVCFLWLPVDLVLSSSIHAGLMQIPYGKAVEVWFVRRLIQLSIVVAILLVGALVYLIQTMNG